MSNFAVPPRAGEDLPELTDAEALAIFRATAFLQVGVKDRASKSKK